MKNTRIFGFKNAIMNPSINPLRPLPSYVLDDSDVSFMIILKAIHIRNIAPAHWRIRKIFSLRKRTDVRPITAINAYIPRPIPWPMPVMTPWALPPEIVFLITTAKLGPGEIAPIAQTNDRIMSDLISIHISEIE